MGHALRDIAEYKEGGLHMAHQHPLGNAHDTGDVGEILFLLLVAHVRRLGNARALVDPRAHLFEGHLGISGQTHPQRILRFAGTWKIAAIKLVHRVQIGTELVVENGARNHTAVEESAIVIEAAIGILRVFIEQLGADQTAIGRAVKDRALGLGDGSDEKLACIVGVFGGHLHAIAFTAVAGRDPGEAAFHIERRSGEVALTGVWRRRHDGWPAMRENDEVAVPSLRPSRRPAPISSRRWFRDTRSSRAESVRRPALSPAPKSSESLFRSHASL